MCCVASAKEKRDFLIAMKRKGKKWFRAWRTSLPDGGAYFDRTYRYQPGVNYALTQTGKRWRGQYNYDKPRGLHAFSTRENARCYRSQPSCGERIFPVQCHIDDLVVMGHGQIVMRKVTILKRDWPKKWKVQR